MNSQYHSLTVVAIAASALLSTLPLSAQGPRISYTLPTHPQSGASWSVSIGIYEQNSGKLLRTVLRNAV